MARPKKSEPRNQQLNLCLTEAELKSICARAAAVGMRPAHFGRSLILDPKRAPAKAANRPDGNQIQLVYNQLARLGSNLNQMMRHCHTLKISPPTDLGPLLSDIRTILARVPR